MNHLYENINYLLDEYAPYKKILKKELKLKSRPWIDGVILSEIKRRDKILHNYHKSKDVDKKLKIYDEYKSIRNKVTKMKRDAKKRYYKDYFESYKNNSSAIWKGIKSIHLGMIIDNSLSWDNHINDLVQN